jgi:hypothetical protein
MVPRLFQIERTQISRDDGGSAVAVSMRVMSAGDGYKYLLCRVIVGDGNRSLSMPQTRY